MDLKAKIAQMIVVRASGYLSDRQRRYPQWEADNKTLQQWLELNLGGVILLGGSAIEVKERSQQLQSWAQTPLFIAADIEEGVGQRFAGLTWFPPPMALGAIAKKDLITAQYYARQMGAITATEAASIGINWLLAPVVDVNNNPDNPVINIRAFGDRPKEVSALTTAFIEGAREYPIITTAKHFPGHGDTATDSHLDLPVIDRDLFGLATVELPPFENAIAGKVDSIMTAHLMIPTWDDKYPATLSPTILSEKLRQELGFDGLIVTDALIMGGITKYAAPEEIAVMAVEAGVDVLLMPSDPLVAIESIYQAVVSGRISEARIDRSLERINTAKQRLNLKQSRQSSLQSSEQKNKEKVNSWAVVREIIKDSLQTSETTLQIAENHRNLIVVDDVLNSSFLDLQTPAIAVTESLGYQRQIVDRNSLYAIAADDRKTLLQLFVRGNPFRGSAGLSNEAMNQYTQLIESDRLMAFIIYGSPYVLQWFLDRIKPKTPWVFTYGQMDVAQAIALSALFNLSDDLQENLLGRVLDTSGDFGF